jgi:hypothetical protein
MIGVLKPDEMLSLGRALSAMHCSGPHDPLVFSCFRPALKYCRCPRYPLIDSYFWIGFLKNEALYA